MSTRKKNTNISPRTWYEFVTWMGYKIHYYS